MNFAHDKVRSALFYLPSARDLVPCGKEMKTPSLSSEWIYTLNQFRYYDHETVLRFIPDRDFSVQSYTDAIQNCIKAQSATAISLSAPAQNTLYEYCKGKGITHPVRNYLDYLIREAALLAQFVPRRCTITYLHWDKHIQQMLNESEMTELMFQINRLFTLLPTGQGRYVVELDSQRLNEDHIALITGIGFTHACLCTPLIKGQDEKHQLCELIKTMRVYGFQTIHTSVSLEAMHNEDCAVFQLGTMIDAGSDTICFATHQSHQCLFLSDQPADSADLPTNKTRQLLEKQLMENGYHPSGCCKYARHPEMKNWFIRDLFALGLSATSLIDNMLIHNASQLDLYLKAIDNNQLPIQIGGYIHRLKRYNQGHL